MVCLLHRATITITSCNFLKKTYEFSPMQIFQKIPKHFLNISWNISPSKNVIFTTLISVVTKAIHETRWNLLGCPKLLNRSQPLVGWSSPYCEDMWRRYCYLTSFFPIVDACLGCEDIATQSCAMVPRWWFFDDFLRPVFSARCAQHISDMQSKFALWPHHVWKYGRHPICDGWDQVSKLRKRHCCGNFGPISGRKNGTPFWATTRLMSTKPGSYG